MSEDGFFWLLSVRRKPSNNSNTSLYARSEVNFCSTSSLRTWKEALLSPISFWGNTGWTKSPCGGISRVDGLGFEVGSLDEEMVAVIKLINDEEGSVVEGFDSSGEEAVDGVKTVDGEEAVDVARPIDNKESLAARSSNGEIFCCRRVSRGEVSIDSLDEEMVVVAELINDEEGLQVEEFGSSEKEVIDGVEIVDDGEAVEVVERVTHKKRSMICSPTRDISSSILIELVG